MEGGAFWEAYRLLGEAYREDVARWGVAPVAPAPPEELPTSNLPKKMKAEDEEIARRQGHRLQQILFAREGEIINSAVDGEGQHFEPRDCWLMHQSPLSPSIVRRKSLQSMTSRLPSLELSSQRPFLMFSPYKPFRQVWDILGVICILLELILNPLHAFVDLWPRDRVAFLGLVEVFLLSFWHLDMLVTMRTAVLTNGNLDFRRGIVFRRYADGWLAFDLLYVVIGWVVVAADLESLRLLQITLRLLRLARLNRVLGQVEGHLMSDVSVAKFNISTLSVQILLILHAMCCAWYSVGSVDDGWVSRSGVVDATLGHRYATSLYWMFCQMGFGLSEIVAATELEVIFGLAASIAGLAIFSFFLGTITSNSALLGKAAEEHRQQFRKLRRYLAYFHIDADLSERIKNFLERAYALDRDGRPESEVDLLKLLSKPMQRELSFALYENCLRDIGFSRHLSRQGHGPAQSLALRHLASHALQQQTLTAKDTVFEAGTVALEAHFLAHGSFHYVLNTSLSVKERWVAEMALWVPWLHLGDLTTSEDSAVVSLKASGFFDCLRRWWNLFEVAQAYARDYVRAMSGFAAVTDLWTALEERPSQRSSSSLRASKGPSKQAW